MEFIGKCRIGPGSQEVIGSIPICSAKIMRQLQVIQSVAAFFLLHSFHIQLADLITKILKQ